MKKTSNIIFLFDNIDRRRYNEQKRIDLIGIQAGIFGSADRRGKYIMYVNRKAIIEGARSFCIILMMLQLAMVFFFLDWNVLPMSGLSGLVFFVLLLCIFLLERERFHGFTVLLLTTMLIYTGAAVLLVGLDNGFQHLLAAAVLLAFYAEYICRSLKMPAVSGKAVGWIALGEYLLLLGISRVYPAPYELAGTGAALLHAALEIIVLVGSILCLSSFLRLSSFSERVLQDQASTDGLTGLYNRKGYERLLEEIRPQATTLLLFDADQFKRINDDFGHEAGDKVLRKIGRALQENFRREDYICRIGGDEFAVLVQNADESLNDLILKKVSRINMALSHVEDGLPAASVSVGAATGAADCSTLFAHADAALYRVKAAGGRGCSFYGTERNEVSAW